MYAKILVPLDGSKLSESVLPYARWLAQGLRLPVELLHVIDPETVAAYVDPGHGRHPNIIEGDMKQKALDYFATVAGSFPEPTTVSCSVEIGTVTEVILQRAGTEPATLIAMTTHGRSGIQRWLLGSIASTILCATANPLLLVRPTGKFETTGVASLKQVVVPLDGSELAEKVLPHVKAVASRMNLDVVLLRVYRLMEAAYIREEYRFDLDLRKKKIRKDAEDYLEEKVRQLRSEGVQTVSSLLFEGDAAGQIIDQARTMPDNLVTMCTHGRTDLGRWILGSVADRVVRHSGDPVLLVRA